MGCGASSAHSQPAAEASDGAPATASTAPPAASTTKGSSGSLETPTSPKTPKVVTASTPTATAKDTAVPTTPSAAPKAAVPVTSSTPKAGATPAVGSTAAVPLGDVPVVVPGGTDPPKYPDFSYVLIQGIEKKPELNGQVGQIVSYDGGADRRYTVKVSGTMVKLREDKLSLSPVGPETAADAAVAGDDLTGEYVDSVIAAVSMGTPARTHETLSSQESRLVMEAKRRDDANEAAIKSMPTGELTATGRLVPTYHWVQVPPVASLPPGMEVWMPVGGLKCARIPSTWRLQVVAEGQVDSYRCDVGEHTPVIDVVIGAAAAFGWEVHDLELRGEGVPIELQSESTVGSSGLFGRKLTARNNTACLIIRP